MTSGAVARPETQRRERWWKWYLLSLCVLAAVWVGAETVDNLGFVTRAWYGWWEGPSGPSGRPYVVTFGQPLQGGATARAGIRNGDWLDAREQTLGSRIVLFTQPIAVRATKLVVHRGSATFTTTIIGTTVWEGESFWKLLDTIPLLVSGIWFLGCALLVSVRRWWLRDGRTLALILLFLVPGFFGIQFIMFPAPAMNLLSLAILQASAFAALFLLVNLSSSFGDRPPWRRFLEGIAYAAITLDVAWHVAFYVGILTLRIDPVPFWSANYAVGLGDFAVTLVVAVLTIAAVAATSSSQRPRAGWLLLPLPLALSASAVAGYLSASTDSWFVVTALQVLSSTCVLLGAFLVTYAVLRRRVFDFGFVLSRTIVVAIVSLIVVIAFVLLEWALGGAVTAVSHATGLIANAGLALVLGVSLRYIHRRVDAFVDAVLFRKRHYDERALRDFSDEAAFATETGALLDQAIAKVQRHTDAREASLLLDSNGVYATVRSFGDGAPSDAGQNDAAILALKTWHKSLDPHHYATALHGALALPLFARGRLLGVLLLGERAGGEAYAPDEVEALSLFAHGIGAALDGLSSNGRSSVEMFQDSLAGTASAIASLGEKLDALPRKIADELRAREI